MSRNASWADPGRIVIAELLWGALVARFDRRELGRIRDMMDSWTGAAPQRCEHPGERFKGAYLRGLAHEPWLDPRAFPFHDAMLAAYPTLRAEAQAFVDGLVAPPVGYTAEVDPAVAPNIASTGFRRPPQWREWKLYDINRRVASRCAAFPAAARLADHIARNTAHARSIAFLLMHPGMTTGLHVDFTNFLVSIHLGLVCPTDSGLEVAGSRHLWQPGKLLAFNNGYVHEAWNQGDGLRVLFGVYTLHPGLTPIEQGAIAFLLSALGEQLNLL